MIDERIFENADIEFALIDPSEQTDDAYLEILRREYIKDKNPEPIALTDDVINELDSDSIKSDAVIYSALIDSNKAERERTRAKLSTRAGVLKCKRDFERIYSVIAKEIDGEIKEYEKECDAVKSKPVKKWDDASKVIYHIWSAPDRNGETHPTDINDVEICKAIKSAGNIIVIDGMPYLYQNGVYIADVDGLRIKTMIQSLIYTELVKYGRIEQCYKLLISDYNLVRENDDVNKHPAEWVNCLDGMIDTTNGNLIPHDPKYLSINQVPMHFNKAKSGYEGSITDTFLKSLIPNDDDREMFLQFCGLCLTIDTTPQKFLIMYGGGGTGKSTVINMLCNVVGSSNISGLSLQDINKRFYPTCIAGKLLNACADIPSVKMEIVDTIKKLIGEDIIMGEYKGGRVFWFRSYAKLLFSANTIPKVYDDKTDAYYRRLMILEIPKRAEYINDLSKRLYEDRDNFFMMILDALRRYHDANALFESPHSKELVRKLYTGSDTVFAFIEEKCVKDETAKTKRPELYAEYCRYCNEEGRTELSRFKFAENLENKGFATVKIHGYDFIRGLRLDEGENKFVPIVDEENPFS